MVLFVDIGATGVATVEFLYLPQGIQPCYFNRTKLLTITQEDITKEAQLFAPCD